MGTDVDKKIWSMECYYDNGCFRISFVNIPQPQWPWIPSKYQWLAILFKIKINQLKVFQDRVIIMLRRFLRVRKDHISQLRSPSSVRRRCGGRSRWCSRSDVFSLHMWPSWRIRTFTFNLSIRTGIPRSAPQFGTHKTKQSVEDEYNGSDHCRYAGRMNDLVHFRDEAEGTIEGGGFCQWMFPSTAARYSKGDEWAIDTTICMCIYSLGEG